MQGPVIKRETPRLEAKANVAAAKKKSKTLIEAVEPVIKAAVVPEVLAEVTGCPSLKHVIRIQSTSVKETGSGPRSVVQPGVQL